MAFKKAKFGSKNPTGDKAFNKIAHTAFTDNAPGAKSPVGNDGGNGGDNDADDMQDDAPQKPAAKPKSGKRYDCATNTFRKG